MKPNPERRWSIQLWGTREDEHHTALISGTIEEAFETADVEECMVNWEVVRVTLEVQM